MIDFTNAKIIKQGMCLYNNLEYKIMILESTIRYGSGDYQDSPEISEDLECLCYYAWFSNPTNQNEFNSRSNAFMSINDAVKNIENESYFAYLID